jgi:hypothetical protein
MSVPARWLFAVVALLGLAGTLDDFIAGGDLGPIAAGFWIMLVLFILGVLFVVDQAAKGAIRTLRRSRR